MNSKRSIAAILILCILFGITGTCVYAAVVEETILVTEETIQELVSVIARAVGQHRMMS